MFSCGRDVFEYRHRSEAQSQIITNKKEGELKGGGRGEREKRKRKIFYVKSVQDNQRTDKKEIK